MKDNKLVGGLAIAIVILFGFFFNVGVMFDVDVFDSKDEPGNVPCFDSQGNVMIGVECIKEPSIASFTEKFVVCFFINLVIIFVLYFSINIYFSRGDL